MPDLSISSDPIRQARSSFIRGGDPEIPVRREVMESWLRCRAAKVPPGLHTARHVTGKPLEELLARNAAFISVSEPLLKRFYKFVEGSGFVISLSDPAGIMLYVIGDEEAISLSNDNVAVGADWGETSVGTNSVGTSLVIDAPCQFWGYEHYSRLPQRWAGSGCSVHGPAGTIIGNLAISGPVEKSHLHTLGMVVMTASAIEMQLKLREVLDHFNVVNQHQEAIINSISEGLFILDVKGEILLANDYLAKFLHTGREALLGQRIGELFSDENLLNAIRNGEEITDYLTELAWAGSHHSCTVTCRKMNQQTGSPETLLLIEESIRAKKLAQRINVNDVLLTFRDIIGADLPFQATIGIAKAAAETSANVLILGESGTGKEVFAQAIHSGSMRKNAPFVAVNCGAIPKELIASTLFGYEEGAFTGAKKGGSPGKFELADKGTLFLDEIGVLSLDGQAVLLRVLDQKMFTRVGGKKTISVDVRIIAATNRDLLQESLAMHFRQDLYYRLNVLSIHLPALRDRKGDIELLSEHFLRRMCQRYQRDITEITEDARELLRTYPWPGNIRELQNTIERAVVLSTKAELDRQDIQALLPELAEPMPVPAAGRWDRPVQTDRDERERLRAVLEECHWNVSKAAVRLGGARSTLYRKMYIYGFK